MIQRSPYLAPDATCECEEFSIFAVDRVFVKFPALRPFDWPIRNALGHALKEFHASRRPDPRPEPLSESAHG